MNLPETTKTQETSECFEDDTPTVKMRRCEVDALMEVVEIERERDNDGETVLILVD